MAATISLCMIVRNEEKVLARCLESVRGCVDEIVIVDTGSSDATKEIAARYTDRIYDFEWIDDFSAARNYAFEQATGDYLLGLDADDVLLPADAAGAAAGYKDEQLAGCDVVMLRYNTAFDELGRPTFFFYRERLIRRTLPHRWVGRVHEVVVHSGTEVAYAEIAVTHKSVKAVYGDRNLRAYLRKADRRRRDALPARAVLLRPRAVLPRPLRRLAQRVLLSFLGTGEGFLENCIDACLLLAHCRRAAGDDAGKRVRSARASSTTCRAPTSAVRWGTYSCGGRNTAPRFTGSRRRRFVRAAGRAAGSSTRTPSAIFLISSSASATTGWASGKRRRITTALPAGVRPESPQALQNRAYFASLGVS